MINWETVFNLVNVEAKFLLRQNPYGRKMSVFLIIFMNAIFSFLLGLAGLGVNFLLKAGILPKELISNMVLVAMNILLFVVFFFGVIESLAVFSRDSDLYILTPSPVNVSDIVLGKTLWIYFSFLIYVLASVSVFFAFLTEFLGYLWFLGVFLSSLTVIFIGSCFSVLVGILLLKLITPKKLKNKLYVLISFLSIFTYFIFQFSIGKFAEKPHELISFLTFNPKSLFLYLSPASWSYLFTNGLLSFSLTALTGFLGLTFFALLSFEISYLFSTKNYQSILYGLDLVPVKTLKKKQVVKYPLHFLKYLINEKTYFFFLNEAKFTKRDVYRLMNLLMSTIWIIFALIPIFSSGPTSTNTSFATHKLPMSFFLGMIGLVSLVVGILAAQSIGFEGDAFQVIKSLPVKGKNVVVGKWLFYLFSALILLVINFLLISVIFSKVFSVTFKLSVTLLTFISLVIGSIGVVSFNMFVAVSFPNFKGVTTSFFGSRRQGVTFIGGLLSTFLPMALFFFPFLLYPLITTFINLPEWLLLLPGFIMFIIGLIAFKAAFKRVEELEVK